jgi:hypothetical protein
MRGYEATKENTNQRFATHEYLAVCRNLVTRQ